MGKYSGFVDTKAARGANYIRGGHYLIRIDAVREDRTQTGREFNVIEGTVIHVFDDGQVYTPPDSEREIPWHSVGEDVSHMMMWDQPSTKHNWKAFTIKALDFTEEEINAYIQEQAKEKYGGDLEKAENAFNERITGDHQVASGLVVEVWNHYIVKKGSRSKPEAALTMKDDIFTKVDYRRQVSYAEAAELIGERATEFFPNLDALLEAEAQTS